MWGGRPRPQSDPPVGLGQVLPNSEEPDEGVRRGPGGPPHDSSNLPLPNTSHLLPSRHRPPPNRSRKRPKPQSRKFPPKRTCKRKRPPTRRRHRPSLGRLSRRSGHSRPPPKIRGQRQHSGRVRRNPSHPSLRQRKRNRDQKTDRSRSRRHGRPLGRRDRPDASRAVRQRRISETPD